MAITTGGGVAFDQGASVRAAGDQFSRTADQITQRKQFQQQQALQTAMQGFMQAEKLAEISGDPEDFFASGEGRQLLDGVTQSMSAALGKQLTPEQARAIGLGYAAEYYARNPSSESYYDQIGRKMVGMDAGAAPVEPVTPKSGTGEQAAMGAATAPVAVPQSRPTPSAKLDYGPGRAAQETPVGAAPQYSLAFQDDPATGAGTMVVTLPDGRQVSRPYSVADVLDPNFTAYADAWAKAASAEAMGAVASPAPEAQAPDPSQVYGGVVAPASPARAPSTAPVVAPSSAVVPPAQAPAQARPSTTPPADLLKRSGDQVMIWARTVKPDATYQGTKAWADEFRRINNLPASGAVQLDAGRQYILPGESGAMAPEQGLSQGPSFQFGAPMDSMRPSMEMLSGAQSSSEATRAGATPLPTRGYWAGEGESLGASVGTFADAIKAEMPDVGEATLRKLGRIELPSAAPQSKTEQKARASAVAKAAEATDKAAPAVDSVIAAVQQGKAPAQRDRAAIHEAVQRTQSLSERLGAMDKDAFRALYKDRIARIEAMSPVELEAIGLGKVASRQETMMLAQIQANSAMTAAALRAGGEEGAALWEYKAKLYESADKVLGTLASIAKAEDLTMTETREKYPALWTSWEDLSSGAIGENVHLDFTYKDIGSFEKWWQNVWSLRPDMSKYREGLQFVGGGSAQAAAAQSSADLTAAKEAAVRALSQ